MFLPIAYPASLIRFVIFSILICVHCNCLTGSPFVCISPAIFCCISGYTSILFFLPPPFFLTRSWSGGAAKSFIPWLIVLKSKPNSRSSRLLPPYPYFNACVAPYNRRCRSLKCSISCRSNRAVSISLSTVTLHDVFRKLFQENSLHQAHNYQIF